MMTATERHRYPKTVDEAAQRLISDLLVQQLKALSRMDEAAFDDLCDAVTPTLLDEFEIWQGNDALLTSCYQRCDDDCADPARIILKRVKEILRDFNGYLVIS